MGIAMFRNSEEFIKFRRKLSILLSLAQELPPEHRGNAMELIEKWKRGEISFEEAIDTLLLLEERHAA